MFDNTSFVDDGDDGDMYDVDIEGDSLLEVTGVLYELENDAMPKLLDEETAGAAYSDDDEGDPNADESPAGGDPYSVAG